MGELGLHFRAAVREDLVVLVGLLADDPLGAAREETSLPLSASYYAAFDAIEGDPHNELIVVCLGDEIVGFLQLTFLPGLTYRGSWRAMIEGVRVAREHRRKGVGKALILKAIERSLERDCRMVELTSNRERPHAVEFYESLGFVASHVGMKLSL